MTFDEFEGIDSSIDDDLTRAFAGNIRTSAPGLVGDAPSPHTTRQHACRKSSAIGWMGISRSPRA